MSDPRFRPSQALEEMEADGIDGAAELRAEEETQFAADIAAIEIAHPSPRTVTLQSRRVEEWARVHRTSAVMLRAAARARWECSEQVDPCIVSEAEYLAAVAFAENPYAFANPPKKTEP